MLLWTILKVAVGCLWSNKLRTFLAMLGINIGVAAVISMLALAAGAKRTVMDRITAMGTNLLYVRPDMPIRGGVRSGSWQSLKLEDARAIADELTGVESVSPEVNGRVQAKYYGKNSNPNLNGVAATYLDIRGFELEKGRLFTSVEEEKHAYVAILGATTANELFGEQNPLGEVVKLNGKNFHVLGVLKAKGDQGWFNPDDMVLVPYTTAMKQIFGRNFLNGLNVKATDSDQLTHLEDDIRRLLRRRHRLPLDKPDDFRIHNQAEMLEMASSVIKTFTFLLGGIASISLLVGGIGIMNIMLVTVTERTREIGVRKAIGARDRDILRQFLLEAILISGLGGVVGVALGVGAAVIVNNYTEFKTYVEMQSVVLALVVATAVGVFFGYYPARRAAKLNPIEALRYE